MSGFLDARHQSLRQALRSKFASLDPAESDEGDQKLADLVRGLDIYKYLIPSEFGGFFERTDVRALCVIREELAYRHPAADSIFAVQGLGSHPLFLAGDGQQKRNFLPRVGDGSALFGFALTEPEAGSDLSSISAIATRDRDGYALSGTKRFISNAGIATHYTVFARTGAGAKGLSAFVVPAEAQGLEIRRMKLMAEHPIGELQFNECRIPRTALVGEEGAGMKLALSTLDVFRSTVGAAAVGMARRSLDEAISYSQKRRQFGAPLAELQGVQFLIAESAAELDASTLLVHRAAAAKDLGADRVTYEAAVAKFYATEAAQRIIDRSLQIHGGNGVVKGFAVERLYRDIRALRIYEGASEVQKILIARHLLRS